MVSGGDGARLQHAYKYREERRDLGRKVVGRLGIQLAMLEAKTIVLATVFPRVHCHLRARFRHAGHVLHGADRIPPPLTGVCRRCQLNCQEGDDEDAGHPEPAEWLAHASLRYSARIVTVLGTHRMRWLDAGRRLYESVCIACHGPGFAGAPRFGDQATWAPRIQQGQATLYEHALSGFRMMPPRGGSMATEAK
ncbi:c-type cytochrome [Cupriavidus pinatubonensis]|uniref:c-type cytochrome n=1 Tax=Cupriavidus pinatubonensis TaxID=248026 RepID=UPI0029621B2F|nr:c-type cytochrome [Cupriavidus pinatubonensis]